MIMMVASKRTTNTNKPPMTNPMKIWDPSDAEADPLDEKSEPEDF